MAPDLRNVAAEVLTDLVGMSAWEGEGTDEKLTLDPFDEDAPLTLQALEVLRDVGFVKESVIRCPMGRDLTAWCISEYGMTTLAAYEKIRQPAPALRPRDAIKDKDFLGTHTKR